MSAANIAAGLAMVIRGMSQARLRHLPAAVFAAVLAAAAPAAARAGDILIFAAASTLDAVGEVGALYSARGGARVRTVFAASSVLARQIASGAPANVFLSANRRWMDWLVAQGKIVAGSRRDLLGNRLVLVVPRARPGRIVIGPGFKLVEFLGDGRLALADPDHVPAGIYARQALENLGVWDAVGRRAARTGDVRGALALVGRGEVPAAIVYATDARISEKVRIAGSFPPSSHAPIAYAAALVAGRDSRQAQAFFAFLVSPPAGAVFARHGFVVQ